MVLTGRYERSIDEKLRVAVPKRVRDDMGGPSCEHLFVAPGTERSLLLYSQAGFEALADRMSQQSSHQSFLRLFYSSAEKVEIDAQGRIRIPDRLAAHAGLSREAMLIGVRDHLELWDTTLWNEFNALHSAEFDGLAKAAFDLH